MPVIAAMPQEKRSARPAFQIAEHTLALDRERVVIALVSEVADLAFVVGPDRRAIERRLPEPASRVSTLSCARSCSSFSAIPR